MSENRLENLVQAAKATLKRTVERLQKWSNRREVRRKRFVGDRNQEDAAKVELQRASQRLTEARNQQPPNPTEIAKRERQRKEREGDHDLAVERVERSRAKYINARKRRSALDRARNHWREALKNRWHRLRDWRADHQGPPPYTDAWLNGHPATLNDTAKHNLRFIKWRWPALYVTSTSRNWGTSSYHELVPTPGFDIAGPWDTMISLQQWIYTNQPDEMLELLGPANNLMVKNGARYGLPEGAFLEDLHDSHDHTMFRGLIW
jgi:hypothetical protein